MRAYGYNRPLSMGTYPKGYEVADIVNFDCKRWVEEVERHCFGYVEYAGDVPTEELERYELITPQMFDASKPKVPPKSEAIADMFCKSRNEVLDDMKAVLVARGW